MSRCCMFAGKRISVLVCTLTCIILLSCGGPNDQDGLLRVEVMDRQVLQGIAESIYDEAKKSSGGNLEAIIQELFESLDMYVELGSEDHIEFLLGSQKPVVFPINVKAMAKGYEKGILVTVESFVDAMEDWGAFRRSNNTPITHGLLTSSFDGLMDQEAYTVEEIIPALILLLGHERVKRTPFYIKEHPVWADEYLDPIQFFLLSCAVMMTGPHSTHSTSAAVLQTRNTQSHLQELKSILELAYDVRSFITSQIGAIIGIPLTWDEALQAIIAASVVLNSYNLEVEMDERMFDRRWPENPGGSPNPFETNVTATLTFDFVPHNDASAFLVIFCLGQDLPENGAGKPLTWTLEGNLPEHSKLEPMSGTTSSQGTVEADFSTFDEKVPRLLRTGFNPPAYGNITARVKELLPGKWRTLEAIVREVKETGLDAKFVTIQHYEFPQIQVRFKTWYKYYNPTELDDILNANYYAGGVPMTLSADETYYYGTSDLYNDSTFVPDCPLTEMTSTTGGSIYVYLFNNPANSYLHMFTYGFPTYETLNFVDCYDPEKPPNPNYVTYGIAPFMNHAGNPLSDDEVAQLFMSIITGQIDDYTSLPSNIIDQHWTKDSSVGGIAIAEYKEPFEDTDGVNVKVEIRK